MPKLLDRTPRIQEYGDHIYITSPVQLYEPEASDIEQFAFANDVRGAAPNPKIMWLRGQYVEADNANSNGDQWTAGELAIKALTPVLMPITVMHDLRSAVGTIADAKLRTPNADQVPRARIDTVLALWAHRFPEIAEEARINAAQGTLMQSMECISPAYDCGQCGATFHRLPRGKEREQWCEHLRAASAAADGRATARILRSVTFTGVGLVFGTRGARGAYSEAHLEVEELAAFHQEAHRGTAAATKPKRRKGIMDIDDKRYEELVATEATAKTKIPELEAKVTEAEKLAETAEAAKVAAEAERDTAKAEVETATEKVRVAAMRDERMAALGAGFTAKLDKLTATKTRVAKQAGEMSDEDWTARLEELSETIGVKSDAKAEEGAESGGTGTPDTTAGTLFEREEITASAVGGSGGGEPSTQSPADQSAVARRSVIGGLAKRPTRRPAPAAKA